MNTVPECHINRRTLHLAPFFVPAAAAARTRSGPNAHSSTQRRARPQRATRNSTRETVSAATPQRTGRTSTYLPIGIPLTVHDVKYVASAPVRPSSAGHSAVCARFSVWFRGACSGWHVRTLCMRPVRIRVTEDTQSGRKATYIHAPPASERPAAKR